VTTTSRGTRHAFHCLLAGLSGALSLPANPANSTTPPLSSSSVRAAALPLGGDPRPVVDRKPPPVHASPKLDSRVAGPKTIVRQPGETPEQLAARVVPAGGEMMTTPLEFALPPLGKVVLVLYQVGSDDPILASDPSVYRGIVLVPDGKTGRYRMEPLPSQKDGAATLMYDIKSVFVDEAGSDSAPKICILSEIAEAGESGKPHVDTDLFKWSGSAFVLVDQGDHRPLYNLRNAKAVRARLKKMRAL